MMPLIMFLSCTFFQVFFACVGGVFSGPEEHGTDINNPEDEKQTVFEDMTGQDEPWEDMKVFQDLNRTRLEKAEHPVLDESLLRLLQSCVVVFLVMFVLIAMCQCTGNSIRLRQ